MRWLTYLGGARVTIGIGLLLVAVVLFARGGLLGIVDMLVAKIRGARQ